ncbi:MAG: hypothetical protein K0U11_06720 [Gammaproteobacteria bacterium]|nr:hypothetical protein [Chlamydiales bacterium]MCH9755530.1 hypothetical protein [Gammaproteobacteria bacterium]
MKAENREEIASNYYEKKEAVQRKKEEVARLLHYNKRGAEKSGIELKRLQSELASLKQRLDQADNSPLTTPPPPTQKELLLQELTQLDSYLEMGQTALKKRWFPLFFARHPKVVLAQMLFLAAKEARLLPKKIAPFKKGALKAICCDLECFCKVLIRQSEQRWNGALYRGHFLTLVEQWKQLSNKLKP